MYIFLNGILYTFLCNFIEFITQIVCVFSQIYIKKALQNFLGDEYSPITLLLGQCRECQETFLLKKILGKNICYAFNCGICIYKNTLN